MLDAIIINALALTSRENALAKQSYPGPSPLSYCLDAAKDTHPNCQYLAVVSPGDIAQWIEAQGLPSVLVSNPGASISWSWLEAAKKAFSADFHFSDNSKEIAILSPLSGVVSRPRLQAVEQQWNKKDGVGVSASQLSPNAHPSWCQWVPHQFSTKEVFISETPKESPRRFDRNRFIRESAHCLFPKSEAITGSQWLPDLYFIDGAVVLATVEQLHAVCSARSTDLSHFIKPYQAAHNASMPVWAYRLPLLEMCEHNIFTPA